MQTKASTEDISSAGMLQARLKANSRATRDFDEWCLRQLPELPMPARVLDLGCGTGKQISLFAPLLSPGSELIGIDLSAEALDSLKANYTAAASLRLIAGDFDQEAAFEGITPGSLDLVYGSYALYYTKDLPALVRRVHELLKPGGVFWVVCPYSGTNDEFLRILRPLHEVEDFMDYVFDRFHQEVIALGEAQGFKSLKPSLLRNQIRFPSAGAFMTYLSNSLFYRPGHDEAITAAVQQVVDQEGVFAVSKNVLSLQLRK
ncbi:MAG: class I SAM-dependent methyltransferase [Bacteroidetes bacterium]|nr:MAG: class I SAM-dependent methyltransferase [Bacteroidota bacterium]